MSPAPPRRSSSTRVIALGLAFALAAALFYWTRRAPPARTPEAPIELADERPADPPPVARDVPRVAAPAHDASVVVAVAASPDAAPPPRRRLLASDPDPMPAVPNPIASGSRDPFDEGDSGVRVRTLASHGVIRVGVAMTADVRDERQVTAIMEDMARELDQLESARADDLEARAHEYQPLLERYGQRLSAYMTGDFAFHGQDWILFHTAR